MKSVAAVYIIRKTALSILNITTISKRLRTSSEQVYDAGFLREFFYSTIDHICNSKANGIARTSSFLSCIKWAYNSNDATTYRLDRYNARKFLIQYFSYGAFKKIQLYFSE